MQPVVQQLGHFEGFTFSINSRSSGWQWLPRAKSANLHRLQRNDYADLDTLWDEVFEERKRIKKTRSAI